MEGFPVAEIHSSLTLALSQIGLLDEGAGANVPYWERALRDPCWVCARRGDCSWSVVTVLMLRLARAVHALLRVPTACGSAAGSPPTSSEQRQKQFSLSLTTLGAQHPQG